VKRSANIFKRLFWKNEFDFYKEEMECCLMGKIVKGMSNLYFDFYVGNVFDMDAANRILGKYVDVERRTGYIKAVYETVLGSSIINETSKIFIKSRKSYAEVARYYNSLHEQEIQKTKEMEVGENCSVHAKTEALVKSDVYYTNKKLKNVLGCDIPNCHYKDFFNVVIWKSEMDTALWMQAEDALAKLKALCNGSLLSKEDFWLNIPVREFNRELSEQEFKNLIELIKPYFTLQKSNVQVQLNEMKREAGYLNYILRADVELSAVDVARRDYILSLTDRSLLKEYKENENPELTRLQRKLLQLEEMNVLEKKLRVELMSKIGFIHYSNKSGMFTKSQLERLESFEKEYEKLKAAEAKRQEDMQQLQWEMNKFRERAVMIDQINSDPEEQYLDF